MLIGVFSDVHDQLAHLRKALAIYKQRDIETLIFCGDFCSPIPVRMIAETGLLTHCVFGNGDGDRFAMAKIAVEASNLQLHGEYAELAFGEVMVAVTHYPFYAKALARTGDYHAVFTGHTHVMSEEHVGECLLLNPGDVLGLHGTATCAVYDTATNVAEIITL